MNNYIFFILIFSLICIGCKEKINQTVKDTNVIVMNTQDSNIIINTQDSNKLELFFTLDYEETSKDCNGHTIEIIIKDNSILLVEKYSGFNDQPEEKKYKKIDTKTEQKIIEFIQTQNLDTNLTEIKGTQGIGIEGHLNLIIKSPNYSKILIVGKTNIWGSDDYIIKEWGKKYAGKRTNIDNYDFFSKAENFVFFIKNIMKD